MALMHADGFDNYTDLSLKYTTTAGQTTPSILTTGGRDGRGCFFGNRAIATFSFSARTALIVGFACKMSAGTNLSSGVLSIGGGTTDLVRIHYESNVFSIRNPNSGATVVTGTTNVPANTWCYLELLFTVSASTGASDVILRVNGQVDATAPSGTNTTWTGVTQATYATFGSIAGALNPFDCYVDDLVILTSDEGFWGDVTVEGKLASSGGSYSMWTPTGATPNFACVNESNPDDDTTYVVSGSLNARDSYTFGSLLQVAAQIKGVQISLVAEKVGSDSLNVAPFFRQSGANYDQTAISLATSYAMSELPLTTNPATGQPWTPDEINALETGPKLTL